MGKSIATVASLQLLAIAIPMPTITKAPVSSLARNSRNMQNAVGPKRRRRRNRSPSRRPRLRPPEMYPNEPRGAQRTRRKAPEFTPLCTFVSLVVDEFRTLPAFDAHLNYLFPALI